MLSTRLLAFLSYAQNGKYIAGTFRTLLASFAINSFLAHEDIEPSLEWQGSILEQLRACDVFIPILTTDYPESHWTDQETGIAFGLGKAIAPLKVDIDPYGFIGKYQALKATTSLSKELCLKLVKSFEKDTRLGPKVRAGVIDLLLKSWSFKEAADNASLLLEFENYETREISEILLGSIQNNQIYQSFGAIRSLDSLISKFKNKIDKKVLRKYRGFLSRR